MLAAARSVTEDDGAAIVAVFLGHKEQELANDLAASRVLYFDYPPATNFPPAIYQKVISDLVLEHKPRLVLFGETSIGAEVAGPLSARLNLPLVSYCRNISVRDGELRYTSQICGGKILVEGDLPAPTALVTMIPGAYKVEQGRSNQPPVVVWSSVPPMEQQPVKFNRFLEPEVSDVDISKEEVLVSVGRGIQNQDNIELAEELARVLGGVVCASRPVVDQGWMPTTRLVGKSGKRVRPKLYLALGISGAPEHVEAISGSEMIVAVNTDPAAPIFDIAQYGVQLDLLDMLELLTEKARAVKVV
jgi:electron transfer flavoprotein alpha subunit